MLASKIMRESEWDAEVDIRDEEFRINNPDDEGGILALPIQWSFMYTDTPQDRVVKNDGREIKNTTTAVSGGAQVKMMAAKPRLETESTVRLHPKLSAVKEVIAVVLVLVSIALQLDPGVQRMAKVAVKQGANVLPRCAFGMIDTARLSAVEDGLFQTGLDGTATIPIANHSSEGMYLKFGDEIGEVETIDLDEVMQVGDEGAQATIAALTLEQQTAVKMYKAELTCRQHTPEITEPTESRKQLKVGGGADVETTENVETRSTESHNTEAHNAHESVKMAKIEVEFNREPQLGPFTGNSGNTGGAYRRIESFRTGCALAPGNVVIGSKPAQILLDGSSLPVHDT